MSTRNPTIPTISAVGLLLLGCASGAGAHETATQQMCLNKLNMAGANVAAARRAGNAACLMKAGMGTLTGTAQSCLTTDALGRIQNQKKRDMTVARETKYCGTSPTFGYTSAAIINGAAEQGVLDLTEDIFGGDLDAAVISCASSKPGCLCQRTILAKLWKLAGAKLMKFVNCKRMTLHSGATSAAALAACVNDPNTKASIAADNKGIIHGIVNGLNTAIANKCDTPGVSGAFPGPHCNGLTGSALGACLDTQVECRVCQIINQMDGLFINCDLFDDQNANGSCASGSGPTPTPTSTPTQTPSPSPTATHIPGATFQGALAATTGLFNYNASLGLTGSDAACAGRFPNSHTCTYAELQTADAANELVGAMDPSNNPVTSFWAIDPAQPFDRQCKTNVAWDYQTAHTGRGGDSVELTGGHLGTFTPGKTGVNITSVCANSRSVGCCL